MKRNSNDFSEICGMLEDAKKKFSMMTDEELEKWDSENENTPVLAGEIDQDLN